ncbi:MAG: hypothetical protein NXI26_18990 [bacterium]|uniref:hypothetical protein n=1 Tax=Phaeodactylibacter xiamenensis TaxID=1524460 RepID=UPI001269F18D|nr:hypothetical protein [Phaeodactylibacter xiamenensis]MCR9053949.1 hypothetical protein [bacterium]
MKAQPHPPATLQSQDRTNKHARRKKCAGRACHTDRHRSNPTINRSAPLPTFTLPLIFSGQSISEGPDGSHFSVLQFQSVAGPARIILLSTAPNDFQPPAVI